MNKLSKSDFILQKSKYIFLLSILIFIVTLSILSELFRARFAYLATRNANETMFTIIVFTIFVCNIIYSIYTLIGFEHREKIDLYFVIANLCSALILLLIFIFGINYKNKYDVIGTIIISSITLYIVKKLLINAYKKINPELSILYEDKNNYNSNSKPIKTILFTSIYKPFIEEYTYTLLFFIVFSLNYGIFISLLLTTFTSAIFKTLRVADFKYIFLYILQSAILIYTYYITNNILICISLHSIINFQRFMEYRDLFLRSFK